MPQDLFTVSTRNDSTLSISPQIKAAVNQVACLSYSTRLQGGFTATVITKQDGTILKKEVVFDASCEAGYADSLRLNVNSLLDEIERTLLGNGDNNGSVVLTSKKV